jgi:hypothetical protein
MILLNLFSFFGDNMDKELLSTIISGIIALVAGTGLTWIRSFLTKRFGTKKVPEKFDYNAKIEASVKMMKRSSGEINTLIAELEEFSGEQRRRVQEMEMALEKLNREEQELSKRMEAMKSVSVPAAEHFAAIMQKENSRGAKRDYLLFAAGVVASIIVSIVLKMTGLA